MEFKDLNLLSIGNTVQMVGAVYAGDGKAFLCLFPGETVEASIEPLPMDVSEWEKFLRQTDLMETEILTRSKDGTLVKAIVRKSNRQIDQNVSWRVFRRDAYRCRYCGADDVPLTVDHLVRWEENGPSTEANLLAACKKCNKVRGNHSYADWLRHPAYRQTSKNLTEAIRKANEALLATLDKIPRVVNQRSR